MTVSPFKQIVMRNTAGQADTAAKIKKLMILDYLVDAIYALNEAIIIIGNYTKIKFWEIKAVNEYFYLNTAQKAYFVTVFFCKESHLVVIFTFSLTYAVIVVTDAHCFDSVFDTNLNKILHLSPTAKAVMSMVVKIKYVFVSVALEKLKRGLKAVLFSYLKDNGYLIDDAVCPASEE